LLTAEDAKLEILKFAVLFMIADIFWAKEQDKCMISEDTKIRNRNLIYPSFIPLLSFTLAKISFTLG